MQISNNATYISKTIQNELIVAADATIFEVALKWTVHVIYFTILADEIMNISNVE